MKVPPSPALPVPRLPAAQPAERPPLSSQPSTHASPVVLQAVADQTPRLRAQQRVLQAVFGPGHTGTPARRLSGQPVVQRRIHEWTDSAWAPGESAREGLAPFPKGLVGENRFFNDVTGKSAATREGAARSLGEIALEQGSLTTLTLPDTKTGTLVDGGVALNDVNKMLTKMFSGDEEQVVDLGYYAFNHGAPGWLWKAGDGKDIGEGKSAIASFLNGLMVANGQMDYIRSRPWFRDMSYSIEVDVNFYLNRRFGDKPFEAHKDTGGANLFVNLVFMNQTPTIGTEVTLDTRPVGEEKKTALLRHMPESLVDAIDEARAGLKSTELATKIDAKELPTLAYVSWVDELIWHSSPFLGNRPKWSRAGAIEALTNFNIEHGEPRTHEAMTLIAQIEESSLVATMKHQGVSTLTLYSAAQMWDLGYNLGSKDNHGLVMADIDRVKWDDFKFGEVTAQDQDGGDPRVEEPKNIETPSGLVHRPRTLSDPEQLKKWRLEHGKGSESKSDSSTSEDLKTASPKLPETLGEKEQPQPKSVQRTGRNFLRTWVRVKKNG